MDRLETRHLERQLLSVRLPQLLARLAEHPVDAIVLQETKLTDDKFPGTQRSRPPAAARSGSASAPTTAWRCSAAPKAWEVVRNIPGFPDEQARDRRQHRRPARDRRLLPQRPGARQRQVLPKMRWLEAARLAQELAAHPQLVLMGDFNIAPEDRDVYDPVAWAGRSTTDEERGHFRRPLRSACTTPSACSSSRPRAGAGGTTATSRSARTRACASTTSSSARR